MYRKLLCERCQKELPPPEVADAAFRQTDRRWLRIGKVLFFPIYVMLFPLFVVLFQVVAYVIHRDRNAFDAPRGESEEFEADYPGGPTRRTGRAVPNSFRYRKTEYTYWRLWDNDDEPLP